MFKKLLATENLYFTLPVRMALALIFFAHGAQKVFGWFGGYGLTATVQFFQQNLGIPVALGYVAAFTELLGGLAVLLGLLTRFAAFALTIHMLVAMFLVHWKSGFFLNWAGTPNVGHGIEMNVVILGLTVALVLAGGGALSLDRKLSE